MSPPTDNHDTMEDVGRKESEARLRNKSNSRYLDDVKQQTSDDYDEALETIEREKMRIGSMDSGFHNSLDLSLHEKRMDFDGKAARSTNYPQSTTDRALRASNFNALLDSSDRVIKISQRANAATDSGPYETTDLASLDKARKADQDQVNEVLAAGKRVFENDLDATSHNARTKQADNEAMEQARAVFGGRKLVDGDADSGKALKYMTKGVKKMTKGLESDH